MPKVLVISACLINYGDDRGGVDHATGEIVDVPKDTARLLADNERVLYADKADDHSKVGRYTASAAMLRAAKAMAESAAKEQAAPQA